MSFAIFIESFFEEIIPVWKVRLLSFFVVCLGPGFSNSPFHVFISFFIHFFHHPHDIGSWIFFLLLLIFSSKLNLQRNTFSYLNCICAQDLFSFLTNVTVILLFLRTYLQSAGIIYPQSFLIAKIWFNFLYPLILISADQFVKIT